VFGQIALKWRNTHGSSRHGGTQRIARRNCKAAAMVTTAKSLCTGRSTLAQASHRDGARAGGGRGAVKAAIDAGQRPAREGRTGYPCTCSRTARCDRLRFDRSQKHGDNRVADSLVRAERVRVRHDSKQDSFRPGVRSKCEEAYRSLARSIAPSPKIKWMPSLKVLRAARECAPPGELGSRRDRLMRAEDMPL